LWIFHQQFRLYLPRMTTSAFELIADPVRLSAVRALADRGSAGLAELAAAAGVHPNTARPHLATLERAGVIVRDRRSRPGRGRPAIVYRLAEGWSITPRDSGLAELLAALVQRLDPDPGELDELGRQWGRFQAGRPGARRGVDEVVGIVERLGFDVELRGSELLLRGCPCPLVSPDAPAAICRLADAVVDGAMGASDERRRVVSAVHRPGRRSCTLQVS
jgi:predicted ArsR family transcriptional regulator